MAALIACAALAFGAATAAADGNKLYSRYCAKCHGEDGRGETKMGKKLDLPDFTSATFQDRITDDQIADYLRKSKQNTFDAGEICELVQVVRAFGGRKAGCTIQPRRPAGL